MRGFHKFIELARTAGVNVNFFKVPLIGKTHCLPPFFLKLTIFRVTGYGGGKLLSAVRNPPRIP